MNLSDCFESAVDSCGEKTALVFKKKKTSYRELRSRVHALCAALRARGLEKGDRIAIVSPNSDKYLEIVLAASRCGLVLENYNCRVGEDVLYPLVEASKPKLLFAHSERFVSASLQSRIRAFTTVIFFFEGEASPASAYERFVFGSGTEGDASPSADDDIAAVFYTSGTTSIPKAVLLTNKNIMSQTIANGLETNWKRGDVYCQGQPLFHVAAFGAYCTLILGGTLVVVDSFELAELILTINENKVTRIGLTPQIVQMFSRLEGKEKRSIKSLDTIVYSGSSMSREILVEAHRRLACNLYGLYGMTEIASIACILHPDEHREIINAPAQQPVPVGRATVGTRIWINDTHGDGVGELFVKNDGVMVGYANEGRCERLLSDGWYATGDIGYRDEEGLYYLVSRKNNMIISGGENIYPLEIENCIRSIGPSVSDVIVIGIPSEVWGEAVHAVVESPAGAGLTQDEVKRYCRKNLSPYKKPKEVWIWDKLPRTANGKVDRVKTLEAILAVNEGASVETRQECEEVRRR